MVTAPTVAVLMFTVEAMRAESWAPPAGTMGPPKVPHENAFGNPVCPAETFSVAPT